MHSQKGTRAMVSIPRFWLLAAKIYYLWIKTSFFHGVVSLIDLSKFNIWDAFTQVLDLYSDTVPISIQFRFY